MVVVVHGELRTTYEPVTAVVRVGDHVAAGQPIGRLDAGHAGCPGTCLHWGLLRGDVYLDPVRLVRAGPSRLLPLDATPRGLAGLAPAPAAAATRATAAPRAAAGASPAPRPAADPVFALRAADAAWGTAALGALIAGLALLRRPRRPPDGPATPSVPAAVPAPLPAAALVGPQTVHGLVDLASERHRRRPEVA